MSFFFLISELVLIHCLIIGLLQSVTKYMLFDNYNCCFLNHSVISHELITLKFVILACMCICRPAARPGCHILDWGRKSSWF